MAFRPEPPRTSYNMNTIMMKKKEGYLPLQIGWPIIVNIIGSGEL